MELPKDIGTFDVIHAANLICRLPDPDRLLLRLPNLLKKGGRLIITTPCTWLGEFTKPEKWPILKSQSAKPVKTKEIIATKEPKKQCGLPMFKRHFKK